MITKNTHADGRHQMMDGTIGMIPEEKENRYYDAEEYAMPGLGYKETEPLCHCEKCEKKRAILNKFLKKDEA